MKKSKRNKLVKNKLMLTMCAIAMPIATTIACSSLCPVHKANAASSAYDYYSSYVKEVTMSNNNFTSSSSTGLSTSISGWASKLTNSNTTAGVINTGTSFQNVMSGTYHLSRNPRTKASDNYILMINAKTSETAKNQQSRQGYSSNKITLSANSYYSFQVAFKADTDYTITTSYVQSGVIEEEGKTVTKTNFEAKAFSDDLSPVYVQYSVSSSVYYVQKTLTANPTPLAEDESYTTEDIFYQDENFVGFRKGEETFYAKASDTETVEGNITVHAGATTYSCNLKYDHSNKNYIISVDENYYTEKTEPTSLNDYVYGSIYLSGLKDENGDPIKADFVQVTSKEWVTFYFFVATGNAQQEASLDLWLGADKDGYTSGGAVFFDDCHVVQYSENAFWKTYNSYKDRSYEQRTEGGDAMSTACTKIIDLRQDKTIDYSSHNLDFETGLIDNGSPVTNWKISGTGKARIYNSGAPEAFKAQTGYEFVGSNLSCKVDIENGNVTVTKNQYLLGLSANKQYVAVTSNDIMIEANSIYKIKAYYKVSEVSEGSVYMFVEESDAVLDAYNISKDDYTLLSKTASSGVTSNGTDQFTNNYGTIEFYVKGGALYNSAIKLSLGLGSETQNATGCVVFDDITITRASSSEFDNATNKATLDDTSANLTVSNGEFNNATITEDGAFPLSPNDWTITSNNSYTYGGVINSSQAEFERYLKEYKARKEAGISDSDNPFYWASIPTKAVGNRFSNYQDPDNVLMLANCKNGGSWQSVKSPNLSLSANGLYRLSFWYNTASDITITLFDSNGFALSKAQKISSAGVWEQYEMYVKGGDGASTAYLTIDFGTEDKAEFGFAYFDHFTLESEITQEVFDAEVSKKGNVVDLSGFYLNLPSNDITTEVNPDATPAFECKIVAGNGGEGSVVSSEKFKESENFKIEETEEKNVFFLQNQNAGTYAIQSRFNIDLASGYWKLSFKLKTHFEGTAEKDEKYGVTIGLTGFDYMSELKSEENFEEYSIYFHPTDTSTAQLYISVISATKNTVGSAVVYDLKLEEVQSNEYDLANTTFTDKHYDVNKDRVLISSKTSEDDSGDNTDSDTDNETNSTRGNNTLNWSILISSIIMGVAILVAVIGVVLRHIKLKKIERKRRESYDRKTSLEVDVVKAKAKQARDVEIAEVQKNVDRFQNELARLEAKHKEKIVGLRSQDKDEVSRATDKEFKDFARKRTAIAEKLDSLNKQIETIKSPEYLLDLERKVYAQEIARKEQIERASKKQNKKAEKEKTKQQKADGTAPKSKSKPNKTTATKSKTSKTKKSK